MWRGNRDAKGWKLKETDDSSLVSAHLLTSLDATWADAHGLDLAVDLPYSPTTNEDEDEATMDHRFDAKLTTDICTHLKPYSHCPQVQKRS